MSDDDIDIDVDEPILAMYEKRLARVAKKSTTSEPKPGKSNTVYTTRRQAALKAKALNRTPNKFMENFDPDNSTREKRKISRKVGARRIPGALYDEAGIHIATGWDLCDCQQKSCPGCHFSCKKCGSEKCGVDCKSNRKYVYEDIEYHGYDFVVKNPTLIK